MKLLQRTLIEKSGYGNGFERVIHEGGADDVALLASARHGCRVAVTLAAVGGFSVRVFPPSPALLPELLRTRAAAPDGSFHAADETALSALLQRAASLALALPRQAERDGCNAMEDAAARLPAAARGTEAERLVRQRVGQEHYRAALMRYWGGACAVTGVAVPEALRASHAKPWVKCDSDAERLDAFNGFLLLATLDALFDRFLISFDDAGRLLTSPSLPSATLPLLGIHAGMALRWLAPEHLPYLHWHRLRFERGGKW